MLREYEWNEDKHLRSLDSIFCHDEQWTGMMIILQASNMTIFTVARHPNGFHMEHISEHILISSRISFATNRFFGVKHLHIALGMGLRIAQRSISVNIETMFIPCTMYNVNVPCENSVWEIRCHTQHLYITCTWIYIYIHIGFCRANVENLYILKWKQSDLPFNMWQKNLFHFCMSFIY